MTIKRSAWAAPRGMSRIRSGGPKTTPAGTKPKQQRRRTLAPTKYFRKGRR